MPDRKIKAILFDLGETLLNFEQVSVRQVFRQGARLSYDYLRSCGQPVGNFRWYCWRNLMGIRIHYWFSHITGKDVDTLALLKNMNTKKGFKLNDQQWRHLAWLWYEPLSKRAKVESRLKETLTALKNLGLKLGIVSNTFISGSSLDKHLQQVGILDFFPVRLYSYQFDFRKPDARIFRIAAERIGHRLENILFVGDHIRRDVKAATSAGMHAVLKAAPANTGKRIPKGAWRINHLSELPQLIERINTAG